MKVDLRVILIASIVGLFGVYVSVVGTREGRDSIKSLSEPVLSSEFHSAFWAHERQKHTSLWEKALSVCASAEAGRPNCVIVAVVADAARGDHSEPQRMSEVRSKDHPKNDPASEIGSGLTGHGAQAGGLPTLKP